MILLCESMLYLYLLLFASCKFSYEQYTAIYIIQETASPKYLIF